MKKFIYILTILFCFIPITIYANERIQNYRIDITVLENGNLHILEAFELQGNYKGFERIINYKGNYSGYQGSSLSSTGNGDIYNGSNIILKEIRGIDFNLSSSLEEMKKNGHVFKKVNTAKKGDYGVYTVDRHSVGETYWIYNPRKHKQDFFLEYELENMVIIHNDIAEVGFNIFTELEEPIDNLEIYIHIPNNKELLRVWAHGPLYGNSKIIDNETLLITISNLEASTAIDTRFVFDKNIVSSNKKTNIEALDKIIAIETELAKKANEEREKAYKIKQQDAIYAVELVEERLGSSDYDNAEVMVGYLNDEDELKQQLLGRLEVIFDKVIEKEKRDTMISIVICLLYLGGMGYFIYYSYKHYDKEYEAEFKNQYFRDFPSEDTPATVGYLMRRKITNDDLSASILDLIRKKVITFEPIDKKNKNFLFKKNKIENISKADQKLLNFIFEYEKENEITLKELKKRAKKKYDSFISLYTSWHDYSLVEAQTKGFYENVSGIKLKGVLLSILGFFIVAFCPKMTFVSIITIVFCIAAIIYFSTIVKKTKVGNEQYVKWKGLKKFMEDFGTIDTKELPDIVLWEKYLVYAITLGCADKLADTMKIKIKELNEQGIYTGDIIFDMMYYNNIILFNRIINQSINTAMNSAYSARSIANTTTSSGGGFGGGFSGGSFGGGGFSGGGGGGRF